MKRLVLVLFFLTFVSGVAFAQNNLKSGVYYVDIQRVINESEKGKQAKALIESKIKSAKEKLKKMYDEIEKLKEELKSSALSKEARTQKETLLQQKIRDYQRFQQDTQIEIANLEQRYTEEIVNDVIKIIREYRQEKGIPVIVEKREAGIIAGDPAYDLTQEIIKLYNQRTRK
jgi:outer membrane protein